MIFKNLAKKQIKSNFIKKEIFLSYNFKWKFHQTLFQDESMLNLSFDSYLVFD